MTTLGASSWMDMLEEFTPELFKSMNNLRETIMAEGALSAKEKTLMMMLCDALLGHSDGVSNIAKRARELGTSQEEIAETLGVAFMMGGMPGLITGSNAFRN
jgi:alkylhydroperoxidase/carboxymuconolactone decarboxylase family protein YurZ